MHLGEISFCDKIGFNIKSDEVKAKLLQELDATTGFKVIQKHHERFHDGLIGNLNRNNHLVSVRSNGNPYLLYLTRYQFQNQCIFIDKKIQHGYFYPRMIITKLWFHDDLFDNTLLDGEMVKRQDGSWVFLVNDMIMCRGKALTSMKLMERVNTIYQILNKMYLEDDHNVCKVEVKKYFTYADLRSHKVQDFIGTLDYTSRGLYFKPMLLKYRDVLLNFDDTLIKKVVRVKVGGFVENVQQAGDALKPTAPIMTTITAPTPSPAPTHKNLESPNTQTAVKGPIDSTEDQVFWIRKTSKSDIYELLTQGGTAPPIGGNLACVNNMKTSEFLRSILGNSTVVDKVLVKCSLHPRLKKWTPYALA